MGTEPVGRELRAFLQGEIAGADFRHADHVRMGFEILRRHDFLDAARAYSTALKDMAARAANPGAYHETITLAFLALIAERVALQRPDSYRTFARINADLFDKAILAKWYPPARLKSAVARTTFILPEPIPPPL